MRRKKESRNQSGTSCCGCGSGRGARSESLKNNKAQQNYPLSIGNIQIFFVILPKNWRVRASPQQRASSLHSVCTVLALRIRVVPHRSGYSTLKNSLGLFPLPMAGHSYPSGERAVMPVDYNSREHPYRVKQEFSPNHRHVPGFFYNIRITRK